MGFIYYFGFVFLLLGKRKGSLCLCLDNLEYFQYPALCTAVLGEILKSCKWILLPSYHIQTREDTLWLIMISYSLDRFDLFFCSSS